MNDGRNLVQGQISPHIWKQQEIRSRGRVKAAVYLQTINIDLFFSTDTYTGGKKKSDRHVSSQSLLLCDSWEGDDLPGKLLISIYLAAHQHLNHTADSECISVWQPGGSVWREQTNCQWTCGSSSRGETKWVERKCASFFNVNICKAGKNSTIHELKPVHVCACGHLHVRKPLHVWVCGCVCGSVCVGVCVCLGVDCGIWIQMSGVLVH